MATKATFPKFVLAQNAAVVAHAGKSTQALVRGLQGMGLCLGFQAETVVVREMGVRVGLTVPAGGTYQESQADYNFIPGDPIMNELREASLNNTLIQDMRLYVRNGYDFSAPDLISDSESGLYMGSMGDPRADSPNALFTGNLSYMPAGPWAIFIAHISGTTLSYTAATRTLADSGSGFVTAGFEAGDTAILDYADSNDPLFLKIESVAAGAIVFEDAVGDEDTLATGGDWTGIATTALHGATPVTITGV